jgi:hypothetical protein
VVLILLYLFSQHIHMKTKALKAWPSLLPEPALKSTMTAYPTSRKSNPGVVKILPTPEPPDEATISRLNSLANQHPFCRLHQVKKHETF